MGRRHIAWPTKQLINLSGDGLRPSFDGGLDKTGVLPLTSSYEFEPEAGMLTVIPGRVILAETAMPEPSSIVLRGVAGLVGVLAARSRRKPAPGNPRPGRRDVPLAIISPRGAGPHAA